MSAHQVNLVKLIAGTIRDSFTSPNVPDANLEAANIVDVVHQTGNSIALGLHKIADAISDHAQAIRETKN